MRKLHLFMLLVAILMSSCLSTRSTSKQRDKVKLMQVSSIERKAPGDRVYMEFPRTPKERPRDTTRTYHGQRGARVDVGFDSTGQVNTVLADCPEVDERELRETEFHRNLRLKETERKMDIELVNAIGGKLIWIAAIFAVTWLARGFIPYE